jgi:hypothetical protein
MSRATRPKTGTLARRTICSAIVAAALTLAAGVGRAAESDWHSAILPQDFDRLENLDEAIHQGNSQAAARPGPEWLLVSELLAASSLTIATESLIGDYLCRTIKVGGITDLTVYGFFRCRIRTSADGLMIEKLTGSQRLSGMLYRDGERRFVLLAGSTVNDEPQRPYSALDRPPRLPDDYDVVGFLERIAANRLRLIQPWPNFESVYDLMELVR